MKSQIRRNIEQIREKTEAVANRIRLLVAHEPEIREIEDVRRRLKEVRPIPKIECYVLRKGNIKKEVLSVLANKEGNCVLDETVKLIEKELYPFAVFNLHQSIKMLVDWFSEEMERRKKLEQELFDVASRLCIALEEKEQIEQAKDEAEELLEMAKQIVGREIVGI